MSRKNFIISDIIDKLYQAHILSDWLSFYHIYDFNDRPIFISAQDYCNGMIQTTIYTNIIILSNEKENNFKTYRIKTFNHIEEFEFIRLHFNNFNDIIEVGFEHIIDFFCNLFMFMIHFLDHYSINKKLVKIRGDT